MKKTSVISLSILFALFIAIVIVAYAVSKVIVVKTPVSKQILEDYILYQNALLSLYVLGEYSLRKTAWYIFYEILAGINMPSSCAPFHLDWSWSFLKNDLASGILQDSLVTLHSGNLNLNLYYLVNKPILSVLPQSSKDCFVHKLSKLNIQQYLKDTYKKILEENKIRVPESVKSIKIESIDPKNLKVTIKASYNFISEDFNHSIVLKDEYYYSNDILFYNIYLSKALCEQARLLDLYTKLKSPEDLENLVMNDLAAYQYQAIPNKDIIVFYSSTQDYFGDVFNLYGIKYYPTLYKLFVLFCEKFGGEWQLGMCKLPLAPNGKTKYYECFQDPYIKEIDDPSKFVELNYTYTFLKYNSTNISKVYIPLLNGLEVNLPELLMLKKAPLIALDYLGYKVITTLPAYLLLSYVYPNAYDYLKNRYLPYILSLYPYIAYIAYKYLPKNRPKDLFIDPYVFLEKLQNLVYYNKIYNFDNVTCTIGYIKETTIAYDPSDANQICQNINNDGYYRKKCNINSICLSYYPCDTNGDGVPDSYCCSQWEYKITYLRRAKYINVTYNYYKIYGFGCVDLT